jgi:hypothetical protein
VFSVTFGPAGMRHQHVVWLAFAAKFIAKYIKEHDFRHCAPCIDADEALAHLSSLLTGAGCFNSHMRENISNQSIFMFSCFERAKVLFKTK